MKYLIDTSALHLIHDPGDAHGWADDLDHGRVAMCDVTEFEALYSARSAREREQLLALYREILAWAPVPDGVYQRARAVQAMLTRAGEHRSAGPVDLLVAATAELSGLTLLHRDRDFRTIARHTGQPDVILPALD